MQNSIVTRIIFPFLKCQFVSFFDLFSFGSINNGTNGADFTTRTQTRHITLEWQQYGWFFARTRPRQPKQFQPNAHFGCNQYITDNRTKSLSLPAKSSAEWVEAFVLDLRRSGQWKTLRSLQVPNESD